MEQNSPETRLDALEILIEVIDEKSYKAAVIDDTNSLLLRLTIGVRRGSPECKDLRITSTEAANPITGGTLRSLALAGIIERSYSAFMAALTLPTPKKSPERHTPPSFTKPSRVERERNRRKRDELLVEVVEAYQNALKDPNPLIRKAPTQSVADMLGYERGHISRLLSLARRTEPPLLAPARKGRAGTWVEDE